MPGAFMLTFNGADESGLTSGEQRSDQAAKVTVPGFSVVVPAFNEAIYIGDCLRSLAGQDFPGAVEVIVVTTTARTTPPPSPGRWAPPWCGRSSLGSAVPDTAARS
jgi:cellulose synthase/poly-beta-1,6-N-acetylglucosamine synthase-like glycosyltransferase